MGWKVRVWDALSYLSEPSPKVWQLAREAVADSSAKVRAAAWEWAYGHLSQTSEPLGEKGTAPDPTWRAAARQALGDSSAAVLQSALGVLRLADANEAQRVASQLLPHPSEEIFLTAVALLIQSGDTLGALSLLARQPCLASLEARATSISLLALVLRNFPSYREMALERLQSIARQDDPWYLRLFAARSLRRLSGLDPRIRTFLRELKNTERHPMLRKLYQREL